jgi:hypothetical protein
MTATASETLAWEEGYERGYKDGESSLYADWQSVLDEMVGFDWPEDKGYWPSDVVAVICNLVKRLSKYENP